MKNNQTSPKKRSTLFYKIVRPIGIVMMKTLFPHKICNKEYIPLQGGAVIAGNHKHNFDTVLVYMSTKRVAYALAKKSLFEGKMGWFYKGVGCIPVDRNAKKNPEALNAAVEVLSDGGLINISPEGTRNKTEEILLPFKIGAVIMAQRAKCPIIPYAVTGDYKFRTKNLKITYGEPLDVSSFSPEAANELLYNTVKELIIKNS